MKATTASAFLGALLAIPASAHPRPVVDDRFPYTGPAVPVGDWVDPAPNGNGQGFPRLVEPPAVKPASANPSNNINVIQLAFVPGGMNIHYQTPFGLGAKPTIHWGVGPMQMHRTTTGTTATYVFPTRAHGS